jgi:cysteine desulfurase
MRERHPERNHIITSVIEHPVVHKVCEYLEKHGYTVTKLPVNSSGRVRVRDLAAALSPRTCLVTVMLANNETGAVQPVAELCQAARDYDPAIMFHTDASQAVGKIHVDVSELNVDLLTVAGHKIYAPKGVGCLYLRPGRLPLIPLLHGPR